MEEGRPKRRVVVHRDSRVSAEPVTTNTIHIPTVEKRGIWLRATHKPKKKKGKLIPGKRIKKRKALRMRPKSNKDQKIRDMLSEPHDRSLYKLYFKTHHWRCLYLRIVRERRVCRVCESDCNLQVHHLTYRDKNGSVLFREEGKHLMLVCKICHDKLHFYNMAYNVPKNKPGRDKHFKLIRALPIVDNYIPDIPL